MRPSSVCSSRSLASAHKPCAADPPVRRYLYVVCPGIRDYLEFGGAGILVFDIDHGHKFVKRIATPASREEKPDNIKGVCACAATQRLYFTTRSKLYCVDLAHARRRCGKRRRPTAATACRSRPTARCSTCRRSRRTPGTWSTRRRGDLVTAVETKSGAHNTVVSLDGTRMYLGGLKSPLLFVADTKTHEIVQQVGPFAGAIRPFTVNGAADAGYVCVNDLLGFEIGDLTTGKKLHRVEVHGVKKGPVKRHGCPSHGIGLTPDEKEVWVVDAFNQQLHVFDNTAEPPKQKAEHQAPRAAGLDHVQPRRQVRLSVHRRSDRHGDEEDRGRADRREGPRGPQREDGRDPLAAGKPVANGDQFGVGRKP